MHRRGFLGAALAAVGLARVGRSVEVPTFTEKVFRVPPGPPSIEWGDGPGVYWTTYRDFKVVRRGDWTITFDEDGFTMERS